MRLPKLSASLFEALRDVAISPSSGCLALLDPNSEPNAHPMSTQTFLAIVFVVILSTIGIYIIDQYRTCVELGYIDCPRIGRGHYRSNTKRGAVSEPHQATDLALQAGIGPVALTR